LLQLKKAQDAEERLAVVQAQLHREKEKHAATQSANERLQRDMHGVQEKINDLELEEKKLHAQ